MPLDPDGPAGRAEPLPGLGRVPELVGHALLFHVFATTWRDPSAFGPGSLDAVWALWMFEFLFLHSTPFLALARGGAKAFWLTVPVYAFFAWGIASELGSPVLLAFFLWHLAGSVLAALGPGGPRPAGWPAGTSSELEREAGCRMWLGYGAAVVTFLAAAALGGITWKLAGSTLPDPVPQAGTLYFGGRLVLDGIALTWGRDRSAWAVYQRVKAADRAA